MIRNRAISDHGNQRCHKALGPPEQVLEGAVFHLQDSPELFVAMFRIWS
jgi:hypothetical protein